MKRLVLTLISAAAVLGVHADGLKAAFTSAKSYSAYYTQNFDSEEEFSTWTVKSTNDRYTWQIAPGLGYNITFNTIDPTSKNSLALVYDESRQDETVTSPAIDIRPGSVVEYYNYFSPNFLLWGSYTFYATDVATGDTVQLLNQFLWAQNEGYDETKWKKFSFDLKRVEGKRVTFSFRYKGSDGESELIDGFRVMQLDATADSRVEIWQGETVQFADLSEGDVKSWRWEFEGGTPATSTEREPVVRYEKAGTYAVKLTVGDGTTTDTSVREGYVVVLRQQPNAVIGMPEEGYLSPYVATFVPTNVPVQYRDLSTGMPTEWLWQFVGGTPETSTEQNPVVTYAKAGRYSLALTASNEAGTDSDIMQYAIQAGGAQYVWNIAPEENADLVKIQLGWYGNYAGSNWLGLTAFAEHYKKPLAAATVDSVDVFFFSGTTISLDAPITLSVCRPDANGAPGEVLASSTIKAGDIMIDPSTWVPTRFILDKPAEIDSDFFVVIEGIPNATQDEAPYAKDDIAIACVRRDEGGRTTTWQLVEDQDEQGNPLGTSQWFENTDDAVSMAVSPVVTYDKPQPPSAIAAPKATEAPDDAPVYTLQGVRVNDRQLTKGIYIKGGKKIVVK